MFLGDRVGGILDSSSNSLQNELSGKPVCKKVGVHLPWNIAEHEEIKGWV